MNREISIIDNNKTFTPLIFYNEFLNKLADFYRKNISNEVIFKLFENGDDEIYNSNYRIDPISIPLLLSIMEQLSKYHNKPLELLLYSNHATIFVMEFLYKVNFFKIASPKNYNNLNGKNILKFREEYLGAFKGTEIRKDHIIRSYDKENFPNVNFFIHSVKDEITLRDSINTLASYYVQEHFAELLFDNNNTSKSYNTYIDILSELITNGVIHSQSTTYVMMFVDGLKTKFSISDNGIGLRNSLQSRKEFPFYYKMDEFKNSCPQNNSKFSQNFINNLLDIFETLYYSSLKERKGLFDLMLNVVLNSNGYFRLHTDNCQIIVSNRIFKDISHLKDIRGEILSFHHQFELHKIEKDSFIFHISKLKEDIKKGFLKLFTNVVNYYANETKYSSIRFFDVKFKGVHIEVEIPND